MKQYQLVLRNEHLTFWGFSCWPSALVTFLASVPFCPCGPCLPPLPSVLFSPLALQKRVHPFSRHVPRHGRVLSPHMDSYNTISLPFIWHVECVVGYCLILSAIMWLHKDKNSIYSSLNFYTCKHNRCWINSYQRIWFWDPQFQSWLCHELAKVIFDVLATHTVIHALSNHSHNNSKTGNTYWILLTFQYSKHFTCVSKFNPYKTSIK